jgi:hypothetical protein
MEGRGECGGCDGRFLPLLSLRSSDVLLADEDEIAFPGCVGEEEGPCDVRRRV